MLSDLANFVEGAAQAIQEAVSKNIKEKKGEKEGKGKDDDDVKVRARGGQSLEDQISAVKQYFEQAAAAQGGYDDDGEEHLVFKTMLPLKEALGADPGEALEHSGPIVFQGLLLKQGRRVNIWKERYFTLKKTGLQYFSQKPNDEELIALTIQHTQEEGEQENLPKVRGNLFFADIMTVTGRVVDDLPMLNNPWLGGREHAFCLHTGSSMYVLAASSEQEKKNWIREIEKVFQEFLNEQVRKVALMELSWELTADKGAMAGKSKKKATLKKKDKARNNILKQTLERTQSRFMGKDLEEINAEKARLETVYGKKFAAKRNRAEEEMAVRKRVENAQSLARVSVSRLARDEHRRISKRSVDDMLAQMQIALETKYERQVTDLRKTFDLQRHFQAWRAFSSYQKNNVEALKLEKEEGERQLAAKASGYF